MSAWGINNFENNVALEWVDELLKTRGALVKNDAELFVNQFHPENTSLDECFKFLAICELFAAINQKPAEELPTELEDWLERNYIPIDKEPLNLCKTGLKLILKDSEVREMYSDTEYYKSWESVQKNLLKRLS